MKNRSETINNNVNNEIPPKKLPRFAKIFYIAALASALLLVAFSLSRPFADFFNRHVSSIYRAVMAHLTGWIPFSLAEFMIIMLPVIIIVLVAHASKNYTRTWRDVGIYCATVLSILALFFSFFTVGFAPAYRGTRLDEKLEIERTDVSAEELYNTAVILADARPY